MRLSNRLVVLLGLLTVVPAEGASKVDVPTEQAAIRDAAKRAESWARVAARGEAGSWLQPRRCHASPHSLAAQHLLNDFLTSGP